MIRSSYASSSGGKSHQYVARSAPVTAPTAPPATMIAATRRGDTRAVDLHLGRREPPAVSVLGDDVQPRVRELVLDRPGGLDHAIDDGPAAVAVDRLDRDRHRIALLRAPREVVLEQLEHPLPGLGRRSGDEDRPHALPRPYSSPHVRAETS